MSYRIKTVAEMTGVPRQTLLSWERRYGLPKPQRMDNGYRLYSEDDIALIVRVQEFRKLGHSVSEAMGLLATREEDAAADEPTDNAVSQLVAKLVKALLDFDREGAEQLDARTTLLSFEQRLEQVYLPVLREVGDRWHAGTASVGQEHFASYFLRERMIAMLRALGGGPVSGPVAICGGYPGEQHEFGLLAVALKLALRGWRVLYLGPDLPIRDLVAIATDRNAKLACQSVVNPVPPGPLATHIEQVMQGLPDGCDLALGGPGTIGFKDPDDDRVIICPSFDVLLTSLKPT